MSKEKIKTMWPEDLKDYIRKTKESDYMLVDVRQPQEYELEHIPGAALIPLPRILEQVERVPKGKSLVFYCAHGMRSRAAAEKCADSGLYAHDLFSLTGGISAWEEKVVSDFPRISIFEDIDSPVAWADTAMNLEKGAFLFYTYLIKKCAETSIVKELEDLAAMETAHARLIYNLFPQPEGSSALFQDVYGALAGDIIEGGQALADAIKGLEMMPGPFLSNALDMALYIEYAAYDLYRSLADKTEDETLQKALLSLSQAEKKHVDRVARLYKDIF